MTEKIIFKNSKGEELVGKLFRGGMLDKSIALFSHDASHGSADLLFNEIAQNLSNNNIPYFKFDYSGYGESQGDSNDFDLDKGIGDLDSAVKLLQSKGYSKILLVGRGKGASIGLEYAASQGNIDGLCLISLFKSEKILNLKGFEIFTLLIHGMSDTLYSPDFSSEMDANLVNSELLLMEGADNKFSHPRDFRKVIAYALDFVFKNK